MTQQKELVDKLLTPFYKLISNSKAGGIILFSSAVLAMIIANSPLAEAYHHLWEMKIRLGFAGYTLEKDLHHWINDGLMAMFFFLVGLELKREIIAGELRSPKDALLPIVAAIGGMLVPAVIYLALNGPETRAGWGVPMATDIAFALGILYLLGDRVPLSMKVFLTAIAIVDDLGAVLVIAFFYTSDINVMSLVIGAVIMGIMIFGNYIGIRNAVFYGVFGIGGLWLAFLLSGVHATIAAVLAAFTIPATTTVREQFFLSKSEQLIKEFNTAKSGAFNLVSHEQQHALDGLKKLARSAVPPLQRLEHGLHNIVYFVVMPIFALSNAGVTLSGNIASNIASPVTMGIFFGLLLGKFIGIGGIAFLLTKLKVLRLPTGMSYKQLFAVSFLAAIGFTMSLFIASLAFDDPELLTQSKIGVLAASLVASVLGYFITKRTLKNSPAAT